MTAESHISFNIILFSLLHGTNCFLELFYFLIRVLSPLECECIGQAPWVQSSLLCHHHLKECVGTCFNLDWVCYVANKLMTIVLLKAAVYLSLVENVWRCAAQGKVLWSPNSFYLAPLPGLVRPLHGPKWLLELQPSHLNSVLEVKKHEECVLFLF